MVYESKYTGAVIDDVIDGRYKAFRQDVVDSNHTVGSPQAITANTEYMFTIDALARNDVTAPTYITDRWDAVNNKIAFPTELDGPTYVSDLSFIFDPSVASAGKYTIRIYIDDATPKLIRAYSGWYKSVAEIHNKITTWYLWTDTGYDAKNDWVYFTIEFDGNGNLYSKGAIIYRT